MSRSGPGFSYAASSDIGTGELKAFGQVINNTGDQLSEVELGIVRANARLQDVITLESDSSEDYTVTYQVDVDGFTDFSGGSGFAGANLSTGAFSSQNDFFNTRISEAIDETLLVERTYNGTVEQSLTVSLFLQLNVADDGATLTADLSNTAALTIILPPGVSITGSESGTLFEVIPIPLPAAVPLFALLSIGLLRARRAG